MRLFLLIAFVLVSLLSYSKRDAWKQLRKDLKKQDKQKRHNSYFITVKDSALTIHFQFFRVDSTLKSVMTVGTHGDTITMYRYLGDDIAIIDRGFKSIYGEFCFSKGKVIHSVQRKGWHIENLDSYIDKGKSYQRRSLVIKGG